MILSEREAKDFFVSTILAEASREGDALSADEEWMLRFSESDPEFVVDQARMEAFERQTAARDFEKKIAGLIRRARERDIELKSDAADQYRDAREALSRGDHYLLVMIEEAFGVPPRRGPLGRVGVLLLSVPAALALLISLGLGGILVTGQTHTVREALPFAAGFIAFVAMSWYLVRLMIREVRS